MMRPHRSRKRSNRFAPSSRDIAPAALLKSISALKQNNQKLSRQLVLQQRTIQILRDKGVALAQVEGQSEDLMSNLPGMAYRCKNERDWPMFFTSMGCLDLTGYSRRDFETRRIVYGDLIHPEDQQRIWDEVQKALRRKRHFEFNYRIRTKKGEEKWVWERGHGVRDRSGRLLYLDGFITDVTTSIRAEASLRDSEERYRSLIEMTHTGYVILDAGGKVLDANKEYVRVTGRRSLDQIRGKSVIQWTAAHEKENNAKAVRDCLRKGYVWDFETAYVDRQGRITPILINATVIGTKGDEKILTLCHDITVRKEIETTLLESEGMFRTLTERSPNMIFINQGGKVVYANPKCEEIMGYTLKEFCSPEFDFLRLMHSDDISRVRHNFLEHQKGKEVPPYEYKMVTRKGAVIYAILTTKLIRYRGAPAILGIITNITERKIAEEEIKAGADELSAIYQNAPLLMTLLDEKGNVRKVNGFTTEFSGRLADKIIGLRSGEVLRCLHALESPRGCGFGKACKSCTLRCTVLDTLKTGRKHHQVEASLPIFAAGKKKTVTFLLSATRLKFQARPMVLLSILDITDRKRTEDALRVNEEKMRLLFEKSPVGIALCEMDGTFVEANEAYLDIIGYTRAEALKLGYWDITPKAYEKDEAKQLRSMAETGKYGPYEKEYVRKTGERVPVILNGVVVTGTDGVKRIWSLVEDMTERKRAEKEILSAKQFSEMVIRSLPGIFYVFDRKGKFLKINDNFSKVTGYSQEQILKMKPLDLFPREEKKKVGDRILEAFKKGASAVEADLLCEDGKKMPYYFTGIRTEIDNVSLLVGTGVDVSERKAAEISMRASKEFLELIINSIPDFVFWKDRNSRYIWCNENFAKAAGVGSPKNIVGKTDYDFSWKKKEADFFRECDRRVMENDKAEYHIIEPQLQVGGRQAWLDTSKVPLRDEKGNVIGILGTYSDITDRRNSEALLARRDSFLSAIIENQPGLVWLKDTDSRILVANQAFAKTAGMKNPDQVVGKTDLDLWSRELARKYRVDDIRVMNRREHITVEEPISDKGVLKWHETFKTPVLDAAGKVIGTAGYARDITERKKAEDALRENEERFRKIIDNSPISMAIVNMSGVIEYINKKAKKTFGYPHEEIPTMARWYARAYPTPSYRKKVIAQWSGNIKKAIAEHCEIEGSEYRVTCKDGSVKTVFINGVIVSDRVFVMFNDITERQLAAEELFKSRQMLQTILDTVPQRIFWKDRNSVYVGCNKPLARDCGYNDPEELIGKTDEDTASAVNAKIYRADDRQVMTTGRSKLNYEEPQIKQDGTQAWLKTSKIPLRDQAGKVTGILGTYEDITERKRAEVSLRESERLLRESQMIAGLGSYSLDVLSGSWESSPILKKVLGIDGAYPHSIEGWESFLHPEWRVSMRDYFKKEVLEKRGRFDKEYKIIRPKDGQERWVHGLGRLELDANGRPVKMIGTIMDVTARKNAEEAVRESRYQLLQIIDTVPHMIFAKDAKGRFLLVNRAVAQAYGKEPKDLIGVRRQDVHKVREETESYLKIDQEILATGRPAIVPEDFFTDLQGRRHILQTIKIPFKMLGVKEKCILGVSVDVTEQKKIEEFRNDIVRTVSHELRTPLSIEKEGISLLLDGLLGAVNPEQKEILETVMRSVNRLSRMIASLLDISRIEAGKIEIRKAKVSMGDLVRDVVFEFQRRAKEKGLEVSVKLPEGGIEIFADADRIIQVLNNLVENSIKFTPEKGTIEISLAILGQEMECAVRDTGIGISSENMDKVFGKFQQFSRTAGAGEKGLGLGLSIAKGIIDMHGGTIRAESELGKGTVVAFTLPLLNRKGAS